MEIICKLIVIEKFELAQEVEKEEKLKLLTSITEKAVVTPLVMILMMEQTIIMS